MQESVSYTYDELLSLSFKLLLNTDYYEKEGNLLVDKSNNKDLMKQKLENSEDVKIVGIIRPNQEAVATSINGAIGYTYELQEYAINKINELPEDSFWKTEVITRIMKEVQNINTLLFL